MVRLFKLIKHMIAFILFYYIIYYYLHKRCKNNQNNYISKGEKHIRKDFKSFTYNKNIPIVFISGAPGSGLDLMRSILNNNDQISCSDEKVNIISHLINKKNEWTNTKIERERLKYAGMSDNVIDSGMTTFILEFLLRQQRLNMGKKEIGKAICQSNPYIIEHISYIKNLIPNLKFIFMIRDPRSTVTHLINNKIEFNGINSKSYKQALIDWNRITKDVYHYCLFEKNLCLPILYEQLILEPNKTINQVLKFLNIQNKLNQSVINNVFKDNNINKKKLNQLFNWWKPYFPSSISQQLNYFAPFMFALGYDPISSKFNFTFYNNNFFK